jgi:hypothetical protein
MTSVELLLAVLTFMSMSAAGALFIFWPEKVETYLQKHNSIYLAQNLGFFSVFSVFLKSWKRAYLIRCMGFGMWSIALPGLAGVLLFAK